MRQNRKSGLASLCLFNFDLIRHQMFPMPLFHVFLERAVDAEGHLANVTAVHFLTELAVRLHVAGELAALGTGVVAKLTLVGPLACVTASVHCQIATVLEHLAAVLAGVTPPALFGAGPSGSPAQVRRAASASGAAAAGEAPVQQVPWRRGESQAAVLGRVLRGGGERRLSGIGEAEKGIFDEVAGRRVTHQPLGVDVFGWD